MNLKVFTDGGAKGNPGPAAIGVVVKDQRGKVLTQFGKRIGKATNNVAEYQGVVEALKYLGRQATGDKKHAIEKHPDQHVTCCMLHVARIDFFLDSKLVVNQLNGVFKIKNSQLRELVFKIKTLEQELSVQIFYHLINRGENPAHLQVKQALKE